jgi:hypothetical protein
MRLIITRRVVEQAGPGPYCMTDTDARRAMREASEREMRWQAARGVPADTSPTRPRSADPLVVLLAGGKITRNEFRAGREIAIVSYVTTLPARGRQVGSYAERTDSGQGGEGAAAMLDMEARFAEWHGWAKRQPATQRGSRASLADLTLLLCVDGASLWQLRNRMMASCDTVLTRARISLWTYARMAGWHSAELTA